MTDLGEIGRLWSRQARTFDQEPDHGLRDPRVRDAWQTLLERLIPGAQLRVADLGCGTGSLSLLLARLGHRVTAVDLSSTMAALAARKLADAQMRADVVVGDAADPALHPASFDVVLCRHLLWTLPEPQHVLDRWRQLLHPTGRLVAIEGRWSSAATRMRSGRQNDPEWTGGVSAPVLIDTLHRLFQQVEHIPLSADDSLWGKRVSDERYAVIATQPR